MSVRLTKTGQWTHFNDKAAGEVEEGNHPAPAEFAIRENLPGYLGKHLLGRLKIRPVNHPDKQADGIIRLLLR